MPLSLDDMAPSQRRFLAKLGGHLPEGIAIGCELGELTPDELFMAQAMLLRGLVRIVDGWRGSRWVMLTETTRRMIAEGFSD